MMFEIDDLTLKKDLFKVPKLVFQEKTISILEFPLKQLFDKTTQSIEFIHKSIYDYFVSEYLFMTINEVASLSKEDFAGFLGYTLKSKILSNEILEFLEYKIRNEAKDKLDIVFDTFYIMLQDGLTYYTGGCYKNVINCEKNIFANMLEILHLWDNSFLKFDKLIRQYLLLDIDKLNLSNTDLTRVDLTNVNLNGADMRGAIIEKDTFKGVRIEESIWLEDDIKRILPQIKESGFVFIYIEREGYRKKVLRSEIILNQIGL